MRNVIFVILIIVLGFSLKYTSVSAEEKTTQYTVGINDMLQINILGNEELNTTVRVALDGSITFPYIGNVNVKGMTLPEIEKVIADKLADGYIKYPVVSVNLSEFKYNKFFVYGEVVKPGEYILSENMTVLQAISLAAGITQEGLYGDVKVKRRQGDTLEYKEIRIDLKGIQKDDENGDMNLKADDVVIVGRNKSIFVSGEVSSPGKYTLEDGLTVMKAISLARGITPGGLYGAVKVKRMLEGEQKYKEIPIDLNGSNENTMNGDMPLVAGDVVVVEGNKFIYVTGKVAQPGKFILEDDMTVLKAISLAGGIEPEGLYGSIKVRRKQKFNQGYMDIELNLQGQESEIADGDMLLLPEDTVIVGQNKIFYVYGEVTRPGKYVLEDNMTVLKAISVAEGFSKYGSPDRVKILKKNKGKIGYESIKVDLKDAIRGDEDKDLPVEPDDIVIAVEGML